MLQQLQDCLLQHNQYVRQFRQVATTPPDQHYALLLGPQGQRDTRYRPVTAAEVAGLFIHSEHPRDVVVHSLVRCSLGDSMQLPCTPHANPDPCTPLCQPAQHNHA